MKQKTENPPRGGGLPGCSSGGLNGSNHTAESNTKQDLPRSQLVERLLILYPSAEPGTVPVREKLLVARDVATTRIGDWHDWPIEFHHVHHIAAAWAGRAAVSPWELDSLEKTVEACRHLLTGTLILRRLGNQYGAV